MGEQKNLMTEMVKNGTNGATTADPPAATTMAVVENGNGEHQINIWKNPENIRKIFTPTATPEEWLIFMGLSRSLGANPFKREIWFVKYDPSKPGSIFLGRDFYRRKAQEQPDYDGHVSSAVYSEDEFRAVNGVPEHSFGQNERGNLIGAYCLVFKKGIRIPIFQYVEYGEYNKNQSVWKGSPATMIEKVAEAQALRKAWAGIFAGTYAEDEKHMIQPAASDSYKDRKPPIKGQPKEKLIADPEPVDPEEYCGVEIEDPQE